MLFVGLQHQRWLPQALHISSLKDIRTYQETVIRDIAYDGGGSYALLTRNLDMLSDLERLMLYLDRFLLPPIRSISMMVLTRSNSMHMVRYLASDR